MVYAMVSLCLCNYFFREVDSTTNNAQNRFDRAGHFVTLAYGILICLFFALLSVYWYYEEDHK